MTFWDGFLPALGLLTACGVAYVVWRFWKVALMISVIAIVAAVGVWGYQNWHPKGRNLFTENQFARYVQKTLTPSGASDHDLQIFADEIARRKSNGTWTLDESGKPKPGVIFEDLIPKEQK